MWPEAAAPWTATGLEHQVFHDPSGRRARVMRAVGAALGAVTVLAVAVVVTGALGFTDVPRLGAVLRHLPRPHLVAEHHAGFHEVRLARSRDVRLQ